MSTDTALDAGQLERLRTALALRRDTLREALALHQGDASRVQHARELLQSDPEDAREHAADREVDQALTEHDVAALAAVDDALVRLGQPGFDQCIDCGEDIPYERLLAQPQALRCVGCEGSHEGPTARRTL